MRKLFAFVVVSAIGGLAACGGGGGSDLPAVDCKTGAVPTYTELKSTVFSKCVSCHSSQVSNAARVDAPVAINFDMYAFAKKDADGAASEVDEGAMPPAPYPALSADEKAALYKWVECGTPE